MIISQILKSKILINKSNSRLEIAKSQPPSIYRHSNIIFHSQSSNEIENKHNSKLKSKPKIPLKTANPWDYYDSFDIIHHQNIYQNKQTMPNLKIK